MASKHAHLVETDETREELTIHRIGEDGKRILYTRILFSRIKAQGYTNFVSALGEAIVLDTPVLRRMFEDVSK